MNKKILFTVVLFMISLLTFAVTYSFATNGNGAMNAVNDAANEVRNVVGSAENTVEGAVDGIGNTMRNSANTTGNTLNNVGNSTGTALSGASNGMNYTANRTATTTNTGANSGNFLGMSSTMWTWVILAVAVVAIIALVWYYSNQLTNTRNYDDHE